MVSSVYLEFAGYYSPDLGPCEFSMTNFQLPIFKLPFAMADSIWRLVIGHWVLDIHLFLTPTSAPLKNYELREFEQLIKRKIPQAVSFWGCLRY